MFGEEKNLDAIDLPDYMKRGVSAWRLLFIANEFNELSICRIISVEWTLLLVAFFMQGLNFELFAKNIPAFEKETDPSFV